MDQTDAANTNRWFVARTQAAALAKAAAALGVPESDITLVQDEDVLDTWFRYVLVHFILQFLLYFVFQ